MGSWMANSSIVRLTFPHRWRENRPRYQVLTPKLIHIKQSVTHERNLEKWLTLSHKPWPSGAFYPRKKKASLVRCLSQEAEHRLLPLWKAQWMAQCSSGGLVKAVRAACRSACNASRQRAHLFASAAVILSPCFRDGPSLLIISMLNHASLHNVC